MEATMTNVIKFPKSFKKSEVKTDGNLSNVHVLEGGYVAVSGTIALGHDEDVLQEKRMSQEEFYRRLSLQIHSEDPTDSEDLEWGMC
jgi:hypothetical protein